MNSGNETVLTQVATTFLSDILDEAREHARLLGADETRPAHLLLATLNRPEAGVVLSRRGVDLDAVHKRLTDRLDGERRPPGQARPSFDMALETALFSARVALQAGDDDLYRRGAELAVLSSLMAIIDRHAPRDPVCEEALACTTMACVDVEARRDTEGSIDALLADLDVDLEQMDALNDAAAGDADAWTPSSSEPVARVTMPSFREAQRAGTGPEVTEKPRHPLLGKKQTGSHLAKDAAEVQAAVARAFRSLTREAEEGRIDPVIGREQEVDRVLSALQRRRKRSVILHGPAGVGKTAIAEGVALALRAPDAPPSLADRTVYELSMAGLVSGARYRGDFEERVTLALARIREEGAIVFIDEIHGMMGLGSTQGRGMDAPNMLKPALARGDIMLIGATTTEEMVALRQDRAIMRRFELIEVHEPGLIDMQAILDRSGHAWLAHHDLKPAEDLFGMILTLCDRWMPDQRFPDKAFDLLDRACVEAARDKAALVTADHARRAAIKAGAVLPVLPGKAEHAALHRAIESLQHEGVSDAVIEQAREGLSLCFLAPAALKGAQAWVIRGKGVARDRLVQALSAAIGRRAVSLPGLRLSGHGAVDWLLGSSFSTGFGSQGVLVEMMEAGPDDMPVFEDIDHALPEVIELVVKMIASGEVRTGSGRVLSARRLRVILTCAEGGPLPIGFGGGAAAPLPQRLAALTGLPGVHVLDAMQMDTGMRTAEGIIEEVTAWFALAGHPLCVPPGLAQALAEQLPESATDRAVIRDRSILQILAQMRQAASARQWQLQIETGQDGGAQLSVMVAPPKFDAPTGYIS